MYHLTQHVGTTYKCALEIKSNCDVKIFFSKIASLPLPNPIYHWNSLPLQKVSTYISWRNGGSARERQPGSAALHADFEHLSLPAGHQLCSSNVAFRLFGLVSALGLTGSSSAAAGAETRVTGTHCAHTSGMHLSWCWPWEGACVPASFVTFLHPRCFVFFMYLAVYCLPGFMASFERCCCCQMLDF